MIVPNQNTKHQSGMVLRNQMVSQDARVFPRDPVFSRSLQGKSSFVMNISCYKQVLSLRFLFIRYNTIRLITP